MNVGRYVFSQVVKYIPRYQFDKCVKKYHGNWHVKDLTCYNQFLHLLFGQLTSCDSLRDHLWVAVIAYLLVARIKADNKSPYSITEVATLIRVSALEKTLLRELITKPRTSVNFNQYVKELPLFENM